MAPSSTRRQQLRDARRLLDWLEANPKAPMPSLELTAFLHKSPQIEAAVFRRCAEAVDEPIAYTPAGGQVLRQDFGTASYRLVSLPRGVCGPPAPESSPHRPPRDLRKSGNRKPTSRKLRNREYIPERRAQP